MLLTGNHAGQPGVTVRPAGDAAALDGHRAFTWCSAILLTNPLRGLMRRSPGVVDLLRERIRALTAVSR